MKRIAITMRYFAFCAGMLLGGMGDLSVFAQTELLVSPGFENGLNGWSSSGGGALLSLSSTPTHSGLFSCQTTLRTATWQGPRQNLPFMVTGVTYQISGWVRLVGAGPQPVRLTIKKTDGAGTLYYSVGSVSAGNDRWYQISGTYPHTVSGTLTILYLYLEGPAIGVDFLADDVSVQAKAAPVQTFDPTATVNVTLDKQEMKGFGAAGAYYLNWLCAHPKKSQIFQAIFGDLGLDILRVRNTYGLGTDFNTEITSLKEVLGAAQTSLGHPLRLMNSSWSPPAALKSNGTTINGGTLARDAWGAYRYADFGSWWADSLLAYRQQGVEFDYASIQNEPDFSAVYDSCRFDPTENTSFAGYNQALAAVHSALLYRVPKPPKLLGPETLSLSSAGAYLSAITNSTLLYGQAHHLYGPGTFDQPDGVITAMRNYSTAYGTKPIFQTEYARLAGGDGFRGALNLARYIHNSLVENQASAYVHWSLFWAQPTNGTESYALIGLDNPWNKTTPGFVITPQYYAFRQYSKFIHDGWHRVSAISGMSSVRISAFRDAVTSSVSVVLINDSTAAATGFVVNIPGFNIITGAIYRTSSTENGVRVGSFTSGPSLALPGESITTLALTRDPTSSLVGTGGTETNLPQIRISSIILTTVLKSGVKYGQARISLVDGAGNAVSGANVTGKFAGDFNETQSNNSDGGGLAILNTLQKLADPHFTLKISAVIRTGNTFAADASILYAAY